jgi:hypothetical protein
MPHTSSSVANEHTTSDRTEPISVKRQPFGDLYPPEAPPGTPRLFVADPDMWLVHEASRPEAVAKRAGLHPRSFERWCKEYRDRAPWLEGWLSGDDAEDDAFPFAEAMLAFRKQTQVKAISKTTVGKRPLERIWVGSQKRRLDRVTTAMIHYWERDYRERYPGQEEWFERWLRRGQNPPPEITVATEDQVTRCSAAWDQIKLAKVAGIR